MIATGAPGGHFADVKAALLSDGTFGTPLRRTDKAGRGCHCVEGDAFGL